MIPHLSEVLKQISIYLYCKHKNSPSEFSQKLIDEVKLEIDSSIRDQSIINKSWEDFLNQIAISIFTEDIKNFLQWDIIQNTMASHGLSHLVELIKLRLDSEWKSRWEKAIIESDVGNPIPYFFYPKSSGTLLQHASHIYNLENVIKKKIDEIDLILDFGGGYGSMCRLIHKLGFEGYYIIYDLPIISSLQRYYLSSLGLILSDTNAIKNNKQGIACISDKNNLEDLLLKINYGGTKTLFIGTFSLSEIPINMRNNIFKMVSNFNYFLIAFQDNFSGVDNVKYFEELTMSTKNIQWIFKRFNFKSHNHYLIGRRQ